jgi:hypothetical protein
MTGKHQSALRCFCTGIRKYPIENVSIHVLLTGILKYLTGKHEHPGVCDRKHQFLTGKHEHPDVSYRNTQVSDRKTRAARCLTGILKYLTGKHEHPGVSATNIQVSDKKTRALRCF